MCHNDRVWSRQLSTVLLGLRTHVRLDTCASPSEYLYGTTLRVPGEFFLDDDFSPNPQIFIEEFREHMRYVRPVPVAHRHKRRAFFFKKLHSCTYIFLKVPEPKRPYTGPHKVLERTSVRVYLIEVKGSQRSVSVDRLKPAHFIPDDLASSHLNANPEHNVEPQQPALKTYVPKKKTTFQSSQPSDTGIVTT